MTELKAQAEEIANGIFNILFVEGRGLVDSDYDDAVDETIGEDPHPVQTAQLALLVEDQLRFKNLIAVAEHYALAFTNRAYEEFVYDDI
jgi:hypothetical protein